MAGSMPGIARGPAGVMPAPAPVGPLHPHVPAPPSVRRRRGYRWGRWVLGICLTLAIGYVGMLFQGAQAGPNAGTTARPSPTASGSTPGPISLGAEAYLAAAPGYRVEALREANLVRAGDIMADAIDADEILPSETRFDYGAFRFYDGDVFVGVGIAWDLRDRPELLDHVLGALARASIGPDATPTPISIDGYRAWGHERADGAAVMWLHQGFAVSVCGPPEATGQLLRLAADLIEANADRAEPA